MAFCVARAKRDPAFCDLIFRVMDFFFTLFTLRSMLNQSRPNKLVLASKQALKCFKVTLSSNFRFLCGWINWIWLHLQSGKIVQVFRVMCENFSVQKNRLDPLCSALHVQNVHLRSGRRRDLIFKVTYLCFTQNMLRSMLHQNSTTEILSVQ